MVGRLSSLAFPIIPTPGVGASPRIRPGFAAPLGHAPTDAPSVTPARCGRHASLPPAVNRVSQALPWGALCPLLSIGCALFGRIDRNA
jgi:hypothetical protein